MKDSITGYEIVQPVPSLEEQISQQDYLNQIQSTIKPSANLEVPSLTDKADYNTLGKTDLATHDMSEINKKQEYLRQLSNESAGTSLGVLTGKFISKIAGLSSLEKQEQAVGDVYLQAKESEGREKRLSDFHVGLTTKAQGFSEYIKGLDDTKRADIKDPKTGQMVESPAVQNIRVAAEKAFDEEIQKNHTRIKKEDLADVAEEKKIWVEAVVTAAKIPTNPAQRPASEYQKWSIGLGEDKQYADLLKSYEQRKQQVLINASDAVKQAALKIYTSPEDMASELQKAGASPDLVQQLLSFQPVIDDLKKKLNLPIYQSENEIVTKYNQGKK